MPISLTDFKKVELTVGKILSAEKVPETDKLLKLMVDFGDNTNYESGTNIRMTTTPVPSLEKEGRHDHPISILSDDMERRQELDIRQIISGIATYFPEPQALVGKKYMFVTNIPPRMIKGLQSNGMILALSTEDGRFSLLEPNAEIPEGTRAR